eukprot:scaffold15321_cov116-Isochrysis_galbana.AAC.3
MEVVVSGPRIPTKVSISSLKDHDRARVEKSSVIADLAWQWQPPQRIEVARGANLGIARGVAHRSARRRQLSA